LVGTKLHQNQRNGEGAACSFYTQPRPNSRNPKDLPALKEHGPGIYPKKTTLKETPEKKKMQRRRSSTGRGNPAHRLTARKKGAALNIRTRAAAQV